MPAITILPSIISKSGVLNIRLLDYKSSYLSELDASSIHLTDVDSPQRGTSFPPDTVGKSLRR